MEGTGCDALVLRRGSTAPDEYAAIWIENEPGDDGFATSFDAWMDYYDGLGVQAIESGLITLRKSARSTAPWFRADDSPETMTFPAGDELLHRFEAEDFLAAHPGDDDLLSVAFRVSSDVRLDQRSGPGEDGWLPLAAQLRRIEGLHWSGNVDMDGASLLARCDGTRPMAGLLADLAEPVGPDAHELAGSWPGTVRRLVECGFLLPA